MDKKTISIIPSASVVPAVGQDEMTRPLAVVGEEKLNRKTIQFLLQFVLFENTAGTMCRAEPVVMIDCQNIVIANLDVARRITHARWATILMFQPCCDGAVVDAESVES